MPNNIPGQIISELGSIAKDVGKQTAKLPGEIAGKALESLGSTSKKPGSTGAAWEQIGVEKDRKVKQSLARKALEELAGGKVTKPREPSIWERLQMEAEQKKNVQQQQQVAAAASQLPQTGSKRPAGDLFGIKAKKTVAENKNVRQD